MQQDVANRYGVEAVSWRNGAWGEVVVIANATVELVQENIWRRVRGVREIRPDAEGTRGRIMVGWSGFQRILSEFHLSLVTEGFRGPADPDTGRLGWSSSI
ncbi:hypothetical protein AK812_SmicGene7530 [Symbiodinium microadriaticum]|uniref:Uncharacterized protein n=1 Tax=Symbiodinium microadriaticum TaxID=2951 RepID=A0A1Q9END5_SYMMI|nr:hypothetical protein AK812_SmicGene7530 [Symbiodinium microadriaticum]